jgi:hypothetical protein
LLIDSNAKAKSSKAAGAVVLAWPDRLCTEQRLAIDLPIAAIKKMAVRTEKRGGRGVRDALADRLEVGRATLSEDEPVSWVDMVEESAFRAALS